MNPALFLSSLPPVSRENFGERTFPEIKITLDGQASGAANRFQLGEAEIAPFLIEADDVPEEDEVVATRSALSGEPRPV